MKYVVDSALNYLGDEAFNGDSREPSPTKSITPLPEEGLDNEMSVELNANSRPESPQQVDNHVEIEANG